MWWPISSLPSMSLVARQPSPQVPPSSSWFCPQETKFHGPNVPTWAAGVGDRATSLERGVTGWAFDGHLSCRPLTPSAPSFQALNPCVTLLLIQSTRETQTPLIELNTFMLDTDYLPPPSQTLPPPSLLIHSQNSTCPGKSRTSIQASADEKTVARRAQVTCSSS